MNPSNSTRPDRIVVVDDDSRIRDLLRRYLTQEGFEVLLAEDAKALNRLITRETIDLIVLDLMLPGEDGLSICRRLRAANDLTPIIMLTAKVEDVDRIVGLEVGADDYLPKPFRMEELMARLRALLRRSTGRAQPSISVGKIILDPRTRQVTVGGVPVALTPLEFRLLNFLFHHRGRVLSQTELSENLYSHDSERDSNAIEALVGRLRKKLKEDVIETRRGFGYIVPAAAEPA